MKDNEICVKVNYRYGIALWEVAVFKVGQALQPVRYCVTEQEAQDYVMRWREESGGRVYSDFMRNDDLEKYGIKWTRCYEEWRKIPYVWKVIDLPDGEELWEENQLGRLFLVKGDEVWEYEF